MNILENASHLVAPEFLLEKRLELEGEGNPVRLLDVAAGSGLMGAELRRRAEERGVAVEKVVGLDSLESARDACFRENPGCTLNFIGKMFISPYIEGFFRVSRCLHPLPRQEDI